MKNNISRNATSAPAPQATGIETLVLKAKNTSLFLAVGTFLCAIVRVFADRSKKDQFKDHTQVAVVFKDQESGLQHTEWFNTKGFDDYEDDLTAQEKASGNFESVNGYAVEVATGKRRQNAKKTEQALSILQKLGYHAGIPTDQEFSPMTDLLNREVGIRTYLDTRGNVHVKTTLPASQVVAGDNVESML